MAMRGSRISQPCRSQHADQTVCQRLVFAWFLGSLLAAFGPLSALGQDSCVACPSAIPATVILCPPTQPTGVNTGLASPCIQGIDSARGVGEQSWRQASWVDFQPLQHGEYIGPVRLPAMLDYRVRLNDLLTFTYIVNRQKTDHQYRLMVGDEININSISDDTLRRERIPIQPDGTIVVPYIGPFPAADKTVSQLRMDLEVALQRYIRSPAINVEPIKVNTALEDLRQAVNPQVGLGGQSLDILVNPDGQLQLPRIGSVVVLGMTMEEIKREVNLRYEEKLAGIEVEPRLARPATNHIFVYGEVNRPGRFELTAPTSVTAGLALAEGLKLGANNRQVVIFRRAEDWRLVSTILDLRGGHLGKRPNPSDEIWLRDGDIIIVPPRPIKLFNNATQQIFTDGIYRVIPLQGINLNR